MLAGLVSREASVLISVVQTQGTRGPLKVRVFALSQHTGRDVRLQVPFSPGGNAKPPRLAQNSSPGTPSLSLAARIWGLGTDSGLTSVRRLLLPGQ